MALVQNRQMNDAVSSAASSGCIKTSIASTSLHPMGSTPPTEARIGRHKQRFDALGKRLCAGCIPIRPAPGNAQGWQVLLVSSRGGKGFGLPKGGWEDDESVEDAARRESWEEAGVRGTLEEPAFVFEFKSGKPGAHQNICKTHVFVMHVAEELDVWPEGSERKRIWCTIEDARRDCRHDWMRDALDMWVSKQQQRQQQQ